MIIEYDTEDRCIRVDDVAVSHADAEKLMAEHETAVAALENALVQYELSRDDEAGALRCAAFLMRYHGSGGQWADPRDGVPRIVVVEVDPADALRGVCLKRVVGFQ